jgi:hypothetical protein
MRIATVSTVLVGLILAATAGAETITISAATPYSENSGVSANVRKECGLDVRLPAYIESEAKRGLEIVLTKDSLDDAAGKVLDLTITHVFAPGGGGYSGAKNVAVQGELREQGRVIGSFKATRRALFGMTPGTCSMLKRVAKALGEDIAGWLREPTLDATLGDG